MATKTQPSERTITVGFSVAAKDQARLERLVDAFGQGNRSAFLRVAMDRMEAAIRAERLRGLQAYGAQRSADFGIAPSEISERVKRVLAARPQD